MWYFFLSGQETIPTKEQTVSIRIFFVTTICWRECIAQKTKHTNDTKQTHVFIYVKIRRCAQGATCFPRAPSLSHCLGTTVKVICECHLCQAMLTFFVSPHPFGAYCTLMSLMDKSLHPTLALAWVRAGTTVLGACVRFSNCSGKSSCRGIDAWLSCNISKRFHLVDCSGEICCIFPVALCFSCSRRARRVLIAFASRCWVAWENASILSS